MCSTARRAARAYCPAIEELVGDVDARSVPARERDRAAFKSREHVQTETTLSHIG
jgi:hypothetical protein